MGKNKKPTSRRVLQYYFTCLPVKEGNKVIINGVTDDYHLVNHFELGNSWVKK